ncbi:MAG: DNA repair protein RadC [Holosporaceae bacterium]|jgi:DNA repair protein RadC|nr:DNA repair protein RadC [Holosporaceae bacterium]
MKENISKKHPHYAGHRQRLRDRFFKYPSALRDYELIELLLFYSNPRKDTKLLAKKLLSNFKSIRKLIFADPMELKKINGIGDFTIVLIKLLNKLFDKMLLDDVVSSATISSSGQVIGYYKNTIGCLKNEQLRVMFLNNKNKLLADEVVQTGTVNTVAIYPREIIRMALEYGASAIIIVHNHPSGDPQPSRQDMIVTKSLKEVAQKLDIMLLDHLIIGKDTYKSLKEMNLI